jgi:arylsulfatase A-like enzyme
MNRRIKFILFSGAMLVLPACACWAQERPAPAKDKKYNVIIILIDALRADHLGCYNYSRDTSPNIDNFAKEGVLFSRAYAQANWTLPSIASIFTSKYVVNHKVFNIESKLSESELTLAEALKIFGYKTAAFTTGIFLNKQFNLCQGFDVYEDIPLDLSTEIPRPPKKNLKEVQPRVLSWVKNNSDAKFFLFFHIMETHPPLYLPEDGNDNLYDPDYKGVVNRMSLDLRLKKQIYGNLFFQEDGTTTRLQRQDINHIVCHYDAAVNYVDRYIGELLKQFKGMGLMENSIIILTADHGLDLFDHNTLFFYPSLAPYDEIAHVPLIIYHPALARKGAKIPTPVQSIDLFPTILDFLDIPLKKDAEGRSLIPAIYGKEDDSSQRYIYSTGSPERNTNLWKCTQTIRSPQWKLIKIPYAPAYSSYELYNLEKDPKEQSNSIYKEPAVVDQLVVGLENWIKKNKVNNSKNE